MSFHFAPGKYLKLFLFLILLSIAFAGGIYVRNDKVLWQSLRTPLKNIYNWRKTIKNFQWDQKFELVKIQMSDQVQKAYFFKSTTSKKQPLLVSLHTWNGDYSEYDPLAELAAKKNINYIHPDFMGPNNRLQACCSSEVIEAIDKAIDYAISHADVDPSKIYITGASGGGYATLCMLMRSKHSIDKFSAWVPVTDLEAWYYENIVRNGNFSHDILECTGSGTTIDSTSAAERSPLKWHPENTTNLNKAEIAIYTGIYDGVQGSVPITHSINFYNKLLHEKKVLDESLFINDSEKAFLLEKRAALDTFGKIADRKVLLKKESENIKILIFEGGHEMLYSYNFKVLIN